VDRGGDRCRRRRCDVSTGRPIRRTAIVQCDHRGRGNSVRSVHLVRSGGGLSRIEQPVCAAGLMLDRSVCDQGQVTFRGRVIQLTDFPSPAEYLVCEQRTGRRSHREVPEQCKLRIVAGSIPAADSQTRRGPDDHPSGPGLFVIPPSGRHLSDPAAVPSCLTYASTPSVPLRFTSMQSTI
jgi:hypothetical protein